MKSFILACFLLATGSFIQAQTLFQGRDSLTQELKEFVKVMKKMPVEDGIYTFSPNDNIYITYETDWNLEEIAIYYATSDGKNYEDIFFALPLNVPILNGYCLIGFGSPPQPIKPSDLRKVFNSIVVKKKAKK